jgi:transposase-like protein
MEENQQTSNQGIPIPLPVGVAQAPATVANEGVRSGHLSNREILETVVTVLTSKTVTEAARKLGIHRNTLYKRMDAHDLRGFIDDVPQSAIDMLKGASIKAAMNLIEDLDSHRPKIRQDASKYILDKSLPEQPKVQVNVQNNTLSMNDFVAQMQQRREERQNNQ